jgi:glycogen debranching enzyme
MHMAADIEAAGLTTDVKTEHQLNAVVDLFKTTVLPKLRLWEFYIIDVKQVEEEFRAAWATRSSSGISLRYKPLFANVNLASLGLKGQAEKLSKEGLIINGVGIRFARSIRLGTAVAFMEKLLSDLGTAATKDVEGEVQLLVAILNEINLDYYKECDADVAAINENVYNRAKYLRVDGHGPKLGPITTR